MARARAPTSPWPRGRAGRGPPRRSCSRSSATPTARRSGASSCWRPTAPPPDELVAQVAADCGLAPSALTFILTPTTQPRRHRADHRPGAGGGAAQGPRAGLPPGTGARRARHGAPAAALARLPHRHGPDQRCDPVRRRGAAVRDRPEEEARDLAEKLPSSASRDYGKPFARIFKDAGHDFYKIDPMLFSPARVMVTCLASGRTFAAGGLAPELLAQSFGDGAA